MAAKAIIAAADGSEESLRAVEWARGASARADLLVIGRRAAGSIVGSITHPVLSHACGSVAIVPSE